MVTSLFEKAEIGETVRYACSRCNGSQETNGLQEFLLVKQDQTIEEVRDSNIIQEMSTSLFLNVATANEDNECRLFQCQNCSQLIVYVPAPIKEVHFPTPTDGN